MSSEQSRPVEELEWSAEASRIRPQARRGRKAWCQKGGPARKRRAQKLGPRCPTPTRSRSRPEPLPVCVLFPLPGLILLSPPRYVYLPRRLSHAAPRRPACPVSGQPSSAVQVCLGRSQGAGFIAISPPLPGSDPFGQRLFRAFLLGPSWCLLPVCCHCQQPTCAWKPFSPTSFRSPTPQPLMDDR